MLVIVYIEAPKNGDNLEAGLQKVGYWANFLKLSKLSSYDLERPGKDNSYQHSVFKHPYQRDDLSHMQRQNIALLKTQGVEIDSVGAGSQKFWFITNNI